MEFWLGVIVGVFAAPFVGMFLPFFEGKTTAPARKEEERPVRKQPEVTEKLRFKPVVEEPKQSEAVKTYQRLKEASK